MAFFVSLSEEQIDRLDQRTERDRLRRKMTAHDVDRIGSDQTGASLAVHPPRIRSWAESSEAVTHLFIRLLEIPVDIENQVGHIGSECRHRAAGSGGHQCRVRRDCSVGGV